MKAFVNWLEAHVVLQPGVVWAFSLLLLVGLWAAWRRYMSWIINHEHYSLIEDVSHSIRLLKKQNEALDARLRQIESQVGALRTRPTQTTSQTQSQEETPPQPVRKGRAKPKKKATPPEGSTWLDRLREEEGDDEAQATPESSVRDT